MSIIAGTAIESALGGYQMDYSVRFNSADSAYLSKTFASSPTSAQKFTQSFWIKRSKLGIYGYLYNCEPSDWTRVYFYTDDCLYFDLRISGTNYSVQPSQVFRDPSAWYHIVYAVDTTQATASNRVKIYINGNQVTAFAAANYPPQNGNTATNSASANYIGAYKTPSNYFDGYMANINFIDGQQLDPTSFGKFNSTTGVWEPIEYTGTYGTNGFFLPFNQPTYQINVLIVAGGGGGGVDNYGGTRASGGGGAGGMKTLSVTASAGATYSITVGAGGANGVPSSGSAVIGSDGSSSVFNGTSTTGGGGGGGHDSSGNNYSGRSGGSGGGAANGASPGGGTSGEGNSGGSSYSGGGNENGSGGGGKGAAGGNASSGTVGAGGAGSQWLDGTYYAGGGGATGTSGTSSGGVGGGGAGTGVSGTANTGGGGGGRRQANAGSGGSGVVIVRYPDSYAAFSATTGSPTVTVSGGYRYYTFTGSGSFTV